jgi:transposase InsO family protein
LQAGVLTRGGHLPEGLILHSDRGSTYASDDYQRLLSSLKIAQSMSAQGNCNDNAAMESFYGKYKTSSVRDQAFVEKTKPEAIPSNILSLSNIY